MKLAFVVALFTISSSAEKGTTILMSINTHYLNYTHATHTIHRLHTAHTDTTQRLHTQTTHTINASKQHKETPIVSTTNITKLQTI